MEGDAYNSSEPNVEGEALLKVSSIEFKPLIRFGGYVYWDYKGGHCRGIWPLEIRFSAFCRDDARESNLRRQGAVAGNSLARVIAPLPI